MDALLKPQSSSVDAVEAVKAVLSRETSDVALTAVIQTVVEKHRQVLLRKVGNEPLYTELARKCAVDDDLNGIEVLMTAFCTHKDLARHAFSLKRALLATISSRAAIAGLFRLPLSEVEVAKITRAAADKGISPNSWSKQGLKYPKWAIFCAEKISNSSNIDQSFRMEVGHAMQDIPLRRDQLDAKIQDSFDAHSKRYLSMNDKVLKKAKDLPGPALTVLSIEDSAKHLPDVSSETWLQLLSYPDYTVRSAAADRMGLFVANGEWQESSLKTLISLKNQISVETYLRAVSSACVSLARSLADKPFRGSKSGAQENEKTSSLLSLTQLPRTQRSQPARGFSADPHFGGVWSYLECFQGQNVLYLTLLEALKEEKSLALFAAHHLKAISSALGKTPWQLCQPYWPSLAPKVVNHYNPTFVDWFCDNILGVSSEDFLLRTATIIIPHLCRVGGSQLKLCAEIASFRGCSTRRLYIDNAASIIAMLLMSTVDDVDRAWDAAEERFMLLDRKLRQLRFNDIVATYRVDTIYEVLMLTTDDNASLATGMAGRIMECAYDAHKGSHQELLQQTVFKLIVKFSETMRNLMGRQSQSTKLAALTGLRILVERFLTPELAASVLRQLTAFLQAALEINVLAQAALEAWLAVVQKLADAQLEVIIDLTYSIISQRMDSWDMETVSRARDIVDHIQRRINKSSTLISGIYTRNPFADSEEDDETSVTGHTNYENLESMVARDTENMYLAQQTAHDICNFCLEHQDHILSWTRQDGPERELLGKTVRMLLNLCAKPDSDLRQISVAALGLIGALDPHKITIAPKAAPLIIVSNFQEADEAIAFSRVLVRDWFLPAFEAAIDPAVQRYFAYGIQELLKFMSAENHVKLELLFGGNLANTLLPLVKTKYTTDMKHWKPPQYPIFNENRSFSDWLRLFCSDMMLRTLEPENATRIFTWCWKVLHGANVGPDMWAFLLPYAALTAVTDPREVSVNRKVFRDEILLVLSQNGHESVQPFHERIFAVIDYFNQWMRSRRQAKLPLLDMDKLLAEIPAHLMAQRALESGSYPRAIRYYEQQVREDPDAEGGILQSLRQMYASMQDMDSLEGISAQMPTLSVEQQVLEYRATSQWDAALACYNALPTSPATTTAALECLQRSGREKEALYELSTDEHTPLASMGVDCAWNVGDWEALKKWTALVDPEEQPVYGQVPQGAIQALGNAFIALRERDLGAFEGSLVSGRQYVGQKLGDIVSTHHLSSLRQIRDLSVYMHGLADMESLGSLVMPDEPSDYAMSDSAATEVKERLDGRLSVLSALSEGPEFEARRFLLSLRGASLSCIQASLPWSSRLIAESHISISSFARKHGQPTIALSEIAAAKQLNHNEANVEHAHLLWSRGESRAAIRMLGDQIHPDFFKNPRKYRGEATLALDWTTWRDITAQSDSKVLVENYTAVTKAAPEWAEAQYRLAKHYVKIYDETSPSKRVDGSLAKAMVSHLAKALELGTSHSSEALPKMLTTWLDLGVMPEDITSSEANSWKHRMSAANKEVQHWAESIDPKLLYTALPQLLSRYKHPNASVQRIIEGLIIGVVERFPRHALWALLEKGDSVSKLLEEVTTRYPQLAVQVTAAIKAVDRMRKLCFARPKVKEVRLRDLAPDLNDCFKRVKLAVPVQRNMDTLGDAWIFQIDDAVAVQASLQRPKRIIVWATNGLRYPLLLKGNDDVRKDARLIEFTSAVNQLLDGNPAAAARHLHILTYRVTPLGANSGIIEWVEGALPSRSILYSLSRNPKLGQDNPSVKKMTNTDARLSDRISAFNNLQRDVPPVLWEWFVGTFPDPESWLEARTRYARTLAVMSMVGYILGLGDRHLENILLIQGTGAVLHVDFDCLFDKGKNLNVPELVPFRLTQQFRDALGVVNTYEGPFRKVSELTLNLVRSNEDLLMVVLEAFIHDPVVQDKVTRLGPQQAMDRTRNKIRGITEPNSPPLGVGGLVDELIQTAISAEKLCQMFKGWMPWV